MWSAGDSKLVVQWSLEKHFEIVIVVEIKKYEEGDGYNTLSYGEQNLTENLAKCLFHMHFICQ